MTEPKRCGNCAWWTDPPPNWINDKTRGCACPVPYMAIVHRLEQFTFESDGGFCPCHKEKE